MCIGNNTFTDSQRSGAWPYAGLCLLKVKERSIVIQMAQSTVNKPNVKCYLKDICDD